MFEIAVWNRSGTGPVHLVSHTPTAHHWHRSVVSTRNILKLDAMIASDTAVAMASLRHLWTTLQQGICTNWLFP